MITLHPGAEVIMLVLNCMPVWLIVILDLVSSRLDKEMRHLAFVAWYVMSHF